MIDRRFAVLALVALAFGLGTVGDARAGDFTVEAFNNFFSPSELTIEVGDRVTWINRGQNHNVQADDGSFRCANGCDGQGGDGSPSSSGWSFSITFNDPGTIRYFCQVHGGPGGVGMAGRIVVEGGTNDPPGNLRFSSANYQVGEGGGSVTVTVQRVAGDDGAVSVQYATTNGSAQAGSDYGSRSGTLNWADNDDDPKTFQVPIVDDALDEPNETFSVMLSNPGGGAGLGSPSTATVTIVDNDAPTPQPGTLSFSSSSYTAGEGAGSATVTVTRSGGSSGTVGVDYATADGSAEAGSDYGAASGSLSWSGGDTAAKTFQVSIFDDGVEEGNETVNLTLSDPTGGAALGTSSATLTIQDDDGEGEVCVPDGDTLCLNRDGRFKAEIVWRDFQGNEGRGQTVDIGKRDSGLFFFFSENNIEMLLKVLNACNSVFDSYWVFYAATTDVEFTLTVTDTLRGVSKQYGNELGQPAAPVLDTSAFATCP